MRFLLLFSILLSCSLYSEPQEIQIELSTTSPLQPIYIGKLQSLNTSFPPAYLSELEAILTYDISYNGSANVLARAANKENTLCAKDLSQAFNTSFWRQVGALYVLRIEVENRSLRAHCFNTQTSSLKSFPDITLSGSLSEDRRHVHKLADAIQKALFQEEGVASTRILFATQVKNPHSTEPSTLSEIWECDWDGANAKQITHENSYCICPVFIPQDHSQPSSSFLYVSYKIGQPKIHLASLNNAVGKRLIDLRGNQLLPAISPQRDKIAFISDAGGRADLFLQLVDLKTHSFQTPVQLFSYPRSTQASPTFSPDGKTLAFVSNKDGSARIYTIPAVPLEKRADPKLLTRQNRENTCPCWSPDGKKLAYSAKTEGIRQIWVYDFVLNEEVQLTKGPGGKENPSWAPDSKHLVFNTTDKESSELYVININQSRPIKITKGAGKKHYPAWGKH